MEVYCKHSQAIETDYLKKNEGLNQILIKIIKSLKRYEKMSPKKNTVLRILRQMS